MSHFGVCPIPSRVEALMQESCRIGFLMACEPTVGAFLRLFAASKPGGRFLEIGTGTGVGAAWMLEGMDASSLFTSLDINPEVQEVARNLLGNDPRLELLLIDGSEYLRSAPEECFDLIFADFRPGKFHDRELAFQALKKGGIYFVDDLLPQRTWPEGHQARVDAFLSEVQEDERIVPLPLNVSSGLFVAVRKQP